jgi:hypothetical protein
LALSLGANGYTVKPMALEEYEGAVARIVAEWMAFCECCKAAGRRAAAP